MVKIEDFQKLKQLDRIEYLLHLKRIEEKNQGGSLTFIIFFVVGSLGFLLLFFLGVSNLIGIEKAIPILNMIDRLIKVGIILIVFGFMVDMICWLRGRIWKKNLESEYFKTEVKPKTK